MEALLTHVLCRVGGVSAVGVDAPAFTHADNWAYSGSVTSGDAALLRAAIADESSWTSDDSTIQTLPTAFSVAPAPPPSPPAQPPTPPTPPAPPAPPPPPPLLPGDCMVVSLLLDYEDFSIVLLSALGQGQSIWVTDDGWDTSTGKFLSESPSTFAGDWSGDPREAHLVHTATTDEPAGTVLRRADFSAGVSSFDSKPDQLLVYQGTQPTTSGYDAPNGGDPTFLCALDLSAGYSTTQCSAPYPSTGWASAISCDEYYKEYYAVWSGLPQGLTNGVDATTFAPNWDSYGVDSNWAYKPSGAPTSGTAAELRAAIANSANWNHDSYDYSSTTPAELTSPAVFSVTPAMPPAMPPPPMPPAMPPPPPSPPSPPSPPPLPPLRAGDCMVVALNMDSNSASTQFAILLLTALDTGVTLHATDDGWDATREAFYSESPTTASGTDYGGVPYESHVSYTAGAVQVQQLVSITRPLRWCSAAFCLP